MEILKAIIALIASYFQHKTATKVEEVKLATATEQAVVNEIRASENAAAVQQTQMVQDALEVVHTERKKEQNKASKKTLNEQLDDAFGEDE